MKKASILLFSLVIFLSCQSPEADLIIHNAKIYTVNQNFDVATAVAVKDGVFIAVGGDELLSQYTSKNTVDLKGFSVYPGFIDAHCHFYNFGLLQQQLDLTGTVSFDEVIERINDYSKSNPGVPILGQGWDQNDWEVKAYPTKDKLDELFSDQIIALKRVDGHALLVNQFTLDLAGIDLSTEVDGGVFVRKNGSLTGVLIDNAMDQVYNALPKP